MIQEDLLQNPYFYQTHAFKDQFIQWVYLYPKTEPNVTLANLLSYVMVDRSEKFSTKQSMSAEMDRLYGLSLSAKTSSHGNTHGYEVKLKTLSTHFIDPNLQKEVIEFLYECVFHPYFAESSFNEAKINLRAALQRLQDQASVQGYRIAIDSIATEEGIKTYSQGSLEILETLSLKDLIEFHHTLIQQKPKIFYSNTECLDLSLISLKKDLQFNLNTTYLFPNKDYVYSERTRALSQSTLTLLFSTHVKFMDQAYLSMRLLSMMLGQLPDSLLFQEVREKHALCYSIHAQLFSFDGLLGVQTGIDLQQRDKTKALILLQIDRLKKGQFSQDLLKVAKKMYKSMLQTMKEDRTAYFNWLLQMSFVQATANREDIINEIDKITKMDIQQSAQKLSLISESLIKGVENE